MTTGTAEDAMRRACDFIMQGDIMSALQDLTPEAFNEALAMGAEITSLPTPQSYEIESREESNGEYRFVARFKTTAHDVLARASWKQIDGAWKITSISAEGPEAGLSRASSDRFTYAPWRVFDTEAMGWSLHPLLDYLVQVRLLHFFDRYGDAVLDLRVEGQKPWLTDCRDLRAISNVVDGNHSSTRVAACEVRRLRLGSLQNGSQLLANGAITGMCVEWLDWDRDLEEHFHDSFLPECRACSMTIPSGTRHRRLGAKKVTRNLRRVKIRSHGLLPLTL